MSNTEQGEQPKKPNRVLRLLEEMRRISEQADALERILPYCCDAETKERLQQNIESYRLRADRLREQFETLSNGGEAGGDM